MLGGYVRGDLSVWAVWGAMHEGTFRNVCLYSTSSDAYQDGPPRMDDDGMMEFAPAGGAEGAAGPEVNQRQPSAPDEASSETPTAAPVRQNFAEVWLWSELSSPPGYLVTDESLT